jgi:F0F1-type ATP synthase delta subunit
MTLPEKQLTRKQRKALPDKIKRETEFDIETNTKIDNNKNNGKSV